MWFRRAGSNAGGTALPASGEAARISARTGFPQRSLIAVATIGWLAGTAAHLQLAALPALSVLLGLLVAGVIALAISIVCAVMRAVALTHVSARHRLAQPLALFAAALLAFSICGLRAANFVEHALGSALEGRDIQVEGTVSAMPQSNELGVRFRFDVERAALEGAPVRLPPRISLGWWLGAESGALPDIVAGDRWRFNVRLKAPHGSVNPHGFDFELWMWEQGLQATGSVRANSRDGAPVRLGRGWSRPVERMRQSVRDDILHRIPDRASAGVVAALVTGDQNAIGRAEWDVFRATGVAHLVSISGLHITMFAWFAAAVVNLAWRRSGRLCLLCPAPTASIFAGLLLAAAYAFFSGWGVPSQRTVLMLATVALLAPGARRWPWPHVWLLTCSVVVAADPWAMLQAGFWLSFVAVGVLFATERRVVVHAGALREAQASGAVSSRGVLRLRLAHLANVWRACASLLREQWIVTFSLAPLTLLLFQQVSMIGLVANLIAIPWVTLVVTPLAMLGVVLPWSWQAAAWSVEVLGWVLAHMASVPFATLSFASPPFWLGAAAVAGGVLIAMRLPPAVRLLGLPLLLPALLWQPPRPGIGEFDVLAADIGQGNAVLVRTAGHSLLYDTGPRYTPDADAGDRVLVPLLRALGEKIDLLVLSHRDADHTGGARAVLASQPRAALLASIEQEHELQTLRPATRCVAGQRWIWDGVLFEILHPLATDYVPLARPNTLSCVLRIRRASTTTGPSVLLAGDIELAQERALLARGELRPVTVLLVPHHGSKTSSSNEMLEALRPHIAIAQAGYRNRFDHPAPVVLRRYGEHGILVADSPHCGAAAWSSALPSELRCEREATRRYWRHRLPEPDR